MFSPHQKKVLLKVRSLCTTREKQGILLQEAAKGNAEKLSGWEESYCDGKWRSCLGESHSVASPALSLKQSVAALHCYGSLREYWAELKKESGILILLYCSVQRPKSCKNGRSSVENNTFRNICNFQNTEFKYTYNKRPSSPSILM